MTLELVFDLIKLVLSVSVFVLCVRAFFMLRRLEKTGQY